MIANCLVCTQPLPDPRSYMSAASELCFVYGTNMDGTQLADDSDHVVFRLFLMKEDKYPLQVVPSDVQRVAEVCQSFHAPLFLFTLLLFAFCGCWGRGRSTKPI